jgi:hypothetical protein
MLIFEDCSSLDDNDNFHALERLFFQPPDALDSLVVRFVPCWP